MAETKLPAVRARVITPTIVNSSDSSLSTEPITKADSPTNIGSSVNASECRGKPYNMGNLEKMVDDSTIIPQCIEAYKTNITGFGIGIKYKDEFNDDTGDESVEAAKEEEYKLAEFVLNTLCIEKDIPSFFADVIESKETFGIAYAEVIRNAKGLVVQLDFIEEPNTFEKTYQLDPVQKVKVNVNGYEVERPKKFCKYRQQKNGKTIYYKEIGDSRTMNALTGDYISDEHTENKDKQIISANEIVEFKIGNRAYGKPRYFGQVLGMTGSRKAEELNVRYFNNGRHTPAAICVNNGTLSEESYAQLQQYMNEIQGEKGQHSFLLLEMEENTDVAFADTNKSASIEIKELAGILQKDGLFKEYINNNRRSVQSSFRLPDLYVAYTTDFNRATARAAIEITESQVFIPERKALAWIINNKILNDYHFKYVEVEFKNPNVNNIDDLSKILGVAFQAGGITPNKAKDIIYSFMGEESEDFEEEWGEIPIPVQNIRNTSRTSDSEANPMEGLSPEDIQDEIDSLVRKSVNNQNEDILPVMKSVRDLLVDLQSRNGVLNGLLRRFNKRD